MLDPNPPELRHHMVSALVDTGGLRSPQWIAAFQATPREKFVDRFVVVEATGRLVEHDLAGADPAGALRAVYTDTSLLDAVGRRWHRDQLVDRAVADGADA